jgi:CRP-like cAMP-binding protein
MVPTDTIFATGGWIGAVLYLVTYALLQLGLLRGNGYLYPALNMLAAGLVLLGLSVAMNWSAAAIQITWILVSIMGIVRIFLLRNGARLTEEEQTLVTTALPSLERLQARRLLARGMWIDGPPGMNLTIEGEPVTDLYYIAEGRAGVWTGERNLAEVRQGLIGEMNAISGGPASATVRLEEPSRLFVITGETLRQLLRNDTDLRESLERDFNESVRKKLIEANARLARSTS